MKIMVKMVFNIMSKEFRHIQRDPQTLAIIIAWPILMLFLFGYAITMEMRQIETVIVDQSKTVQSRNFIERIISTDFFKISAVDIPEAKFEQIFNRREARCIIVIPYNFGRSLQNKGTTKVQLLIDASDPNAANYINKYFSQINLKYIEETNRGLTFPFTVESQILYNPQLKSDYFFVPGLIAIIIILISSLLTSIAIVREKEMGTMEQILVSPVKSYQIIIGKLIPYTVIGLLDAMIILAVSQLVFGVPVHGSYLLLALNLLIYIITGLSFGLLISTIAQKQQVAMLAALIVTLLPTIMLSGFMFPIKSMPLFFQYLSLIFPATHFLEIIRGIMLKGVGLAELFRPMIWLSGIALFFNLVSIKKFKTTLE